MNDALALIQAEIEAAHAALQYWAAKDIDVPECVQEALDHLNSALIEAWNYQQSKLDAQAEELGALRGALQTINKLEFRRFSDGRYANNSMKQIYKIFKLIDTDGNPTQLLTGEKK